MLDGPPIKMAVLSKPNNVWSHLRMRTIKKQGNLSQVLRIKSARASLTVQRVMRVSPHHLWIAILGRRALPIPAEIHRRPSPHRQTKSCEPARHWRSDGVFTP